jgi:hypothetical protein
VAERCAHDELGHLPECAPAPLSARFRRGLEHVLGRVAEHSGEVVSALQAVPDDVPDRAPEHRAVLGCVPGEGLDGPFVQWPHRAQELELLAACGLVARKRRAVICSCGQRS